MPSVLLWKRARKHVLRVLSVTNHLLCLLSACVSIFLEANCTAALLFNVIASVFHCQSKPDSKSRKRRAADLEGKVKKNRSDSESMLDSSDNSGNEDLGNEADSDDNNQVGWGSVSPHLPRVLLLLSTVSEQRSACQNSIL